jgi:small-conductance mechanosensitive channel
MEEITKAVEHSFDKLFTRNTLTEVAAAVVALALAWFAGRFIQGWQQRQREPGVVPTFRTRLFEGAMRVSPYVIAVLLIFVVRSIFQQVGLSTDFVGLVLRLMSALALIRIAVFLLRLSLGPNSWLRTWEEGVTFILWPIVIINMFGWLDPVVAWLDGIKFGAKNNITAWSIFKSLLIVTLFVLVGTWIARMLERRLMGVQTIAASTRIGISKFAHAFLVAFSILVGLSVSGLDLTTLTIFTGAIGIGLGFGLQAIASNFVSGFVLLMDRSIKPGDVISFTGVGGTSTEGFGWVQELRGRYVVVRDRDGVEMLVPNQNLITNPVINWSYTDPKVRLKLPVRISYRDDPEMAMRVLLKAAEGHRRILKEPAPVSRLMHFNDYGMDLELRFWIADPQEGVNNVRSDVNRAIWRLFKEHSITIPVAQREVHFVSGRDEAEDWAAFGERKQVKD